MKTNNFIFWKLPALLWSLTILALTSYPKLEIPDIGFSAMDKLAHMSVYYVFGFLLIRAFMENRQDLPFYDYCRIGLYGIAFAVFDELHQKVIPGRFCEFWDGMADIIGIVLGIITFYIIKDRAIKKIADEVGE